MRKPHAMKINLIHYAPLCAMLAVSSCISTDSDGHKPTTTTTVTEETVTPQPYTNPDLTQTTKTTTTRTSP
jgi:hypothetical protein